jgi:hypothetical protein
MLLCIKIGKPDPDPDDTSSIISLMVVDWLVSRTRG